MDLRARRIITRGVIDMATSAILESEGYDYTGPMALCDEADLAPITKSIAEIGEATKAAGVKVDKQLAAITEHTEKTDARILALEQKILTGAGVGGGAGGGAPVPNLGAIIAKGLNYDELKNRNAWVRTPIAGSIRQIMKSVLVNTGTSGASPETGFPTVGELLPGGPFGFTHRRLSILAALTSIPVNTAKVEFPKLTTNTATATPLCKPMKVAPRLPAISASRWRSSRTRQSRLTSPRRARCSETRRCWLSSSTRFCSSRCFGNSRT
jgi:hypothetical protein